MSDITHEELRVLVRETVQETLVSLGLPTDPLVAQARMQFLGELLSERKRMNEAVQFVEEWRDTTKAVREKSIYVLVAGLSAMAIALGTLWVQRMFSGSN